MKARLITLTSVIMSIGIVIITVALLSAVILQNTVFSMSFYQKVTTSPNYLAMVKQAITHDFYAQSSYVAIPIEHLTAGLDDKKLAEALQVHIDNVVVFLKYEGDFVKSEYSADLFYKPLEDFIQADGVKNEYSPSEEQYTLLHEVANDSAKIVMGHVNLINIDLVKNSSVFAKIHRVLYTVSNLVWPAVVGLAVLLLCLILVNWKKWSRSVLFAFTSFWIVGALLLIPTLVIERVGITGRLAIQTAYLKYAVDSLLTNSNRLVLIIGCCLFFISTVVLILRILLEKSKKI